MCTEPRRLLARFDSDVLQAKVVAIPVEDADLQRSWGTSLQRIVLEYAAEASRGA